MEIARLSTHFATSVSDAPELKRSPSCQSPLPWKPVLHRAGSHHRALWKHGCYCHASLNHRSYTALPERFHKNLPLLPQLLLLQHARYFRWQNSKLLALVCFPDAPHPARRLTDAAPANTIEIHFFNLIISSPFLHQSTTFIINLFSKCCGSVGTKPGRHTRSG